MEELRNFAASTALNPRAPAVKSREAAEGGTI
jgi:hypothetical protein